MELFHKVTTTFNYMVNYKHGLDWKPQIERWDSPSPTMTKDGAALHHIISMNWSRTPPIVIP